MISIEQKAPAKKLHCLQPYWLKRLKPTINHRNPSNWSMRSISTHNRPYYWVFLSKEAIECGKPHKTFVFKKTFLRNSNLQKKKFKEKLIRVHKHDRMHLVTICSSLSAKSYMWKRGNIPLFFTPLQSFLTFGLIRNTLKEQSYNGDYMTLVCPYKRGRAYRPLVWPFVCCLYYILQCKFNEHAVKFNLWQILRVRKHTILENGDCEDNTSFDKKKMGVRGLSSRWNIAANI